MGLLGATSMGMMAVLALVYLFHGLAYSRAMFLFAWALIFGLLAANRGLERLVKAIRLRRGVGVKRVVVVGGENLGRQVMHVIATDPGLGYQLAGFVQENGVGDLGRFRSLGKVEELSRVLQEHQIDEVIVALPSSSHYLIPEIAELCRHQGRAFRLVPDLYEMSLGRVDINDLRGIPI